MSTQYIDAVLRLIDKFTGPMNGAMDKLSKSSRTLNQVGRSVGKVGKSVTSAGTALTMGVTAPVVAFGTTAVKAFGETDKTLRLVQQTMGSTDAEADALRKTMRSAAMDSVYGMQDAADATLNFARQGWSAAEAGDMLSPALSLAAGTATDLSTVTAGLGSAMKAFGADTSEAANYTDILAVAQGQANTNVTELFDALSTGGAMAKTVGWDMQDLAVATGVLGDAMISGSEAGTAFKSGLANLSSNDTALGMLEKLGIEITNADGTYKSFTETQRLLHDSFEGLTKVEQVQAATALFGKNQANKWMTLIQKSPSEIAKMSDALSEAAGNTKSESKNMADALMSGVGGSIERLKSTFDVLRDEVGQIMGDMASPVIEKITSMMKAFSDLPDSAKKNIVSMVMKFAALGPALLIFGKITTGVGSLITTAGKLGRAVSKAGGLVALITSPAGIVIGVLAGIALATVLIIKNWDKVKPVIQKVWGYVKGVFSGLGLHFDVIKGQMGNFIGTVKEDIGRLTEVFGPVLSFFGDVLAVKISVAFGIISGVIGAAGQLIMDVFGGVMDVFSGVIDFLTGVFTGDWAKVWDGVQKIFEGFAEVLVGIFKAPINAIIGIINGVVGAINGLGFDVPDWVPVIGGQKFSLNIPTIPMLAKGTNYAPGGLAIVGEKGPELVNLPRGSRVYSNAESRRMAAGGGVTLNISKLADTMNIRDDSDIDKLAAAIALQMENRIGNMVWES